MDGQGDACDYGEEEVCVDSFPEQQRDGTSSYDVLVLSSGDWFPPVTLPLSTRSCMCSFVVFHSVDCEVALFQRVLPLGWN